MTTVKVFAPAKINLTLHVTGRRDDGYHLLDTLVAFADIGDTVTLHASGPLALDVSGPEAAPELNSKYNIMWLVAARFWKPDLPLSLGLEKHLPMASGIGGGSADAAATFRGLLRLRAALEGRAPRDVTEADVRTLLDIGADVPMCVLSDAARVQGIGERITPLADFPALAVVLVNPRVQVSTLEVFKSLETRDNPGLDSFPDSFNDQAALLDWLSGQRNDLQAAAMADCPAIGTVLDALRSHDTCRLARMSGSGATCFGLYDSVAAARASAAAVQAAHPEWWVRAGTLDGGNCVAPQLIRSTT
jgi:4-diphosphocytidyl-2-C-methyl-D-erythritol kinase